MHIATKSSKIDLSKESLTAQFAKKFSRILKQGDVVLLYGEIGVGKTTFVRYLINSLENDSKIKLSEITSPTFSILNEYTIKNIIIYHYDLFRIKNTNEINNLGIYENLNNAITIIEWPERINKKIKNKYNLFFKYDLDGKKRILEINKEDI